MPDLSDVGPGFADAATDSQAVFRHGLAALSRPGSVLECCATAQPPAGLHAAANALLLALLDQDTRLWLSPGVSGAAGGYLRFHTGCVLVGEPGQADFALAAAPAELPPLGTFHAGSVEYPDRSATVVVQVDALDAGREWRIAGPGIRGESMVRVAGLGNDFLAQWRENGKRFPQGVDLFLVHGTRLCGLPRTTRIGP